MTSYSREAAVFSQSHFSSKELNSAEQSAKKCTCSVGVNTSFSLYYVCALIVDVGAFLWTQSLLMLTRQSQHAKFKYGRNLILLFK